MGVSYSTIGTRLRSAREARGLTLKALADAMGVTSSLLSQIETNKVQPSLNTLYQLAVRLELSVDELLGVRPSKAASAPAPVPLEHDSGPLTVVFQRQQDSPTLEMTGGVRWERLAGGAEFGVDPLRITYAPRTSSSSDGSLVRNAGVEFGVLLEGELTLQVAFEEFHMKPGDSVYFDTARPHVYRNEGDQPAVGLWFVVRTGSFLEAGLADPGVLRSGSLTAILRALDTRDDW